MRHYSREDDLPDGVVDMATMATIIAAELKRERRGRTFTSRTAQENAKSRQSGLAQSRRRRKGMQGRNP